MKGGKWYMTQKANSLLKSFEDGEVIINSFLFGEGSGQLANDFFLKNVGTAFDKNFIEKNKQDVVALINESNDHQILKISLFGCLKFWMEDLNTSEHNISENMKANQLLSEVNFQYQRDTPSIIPGTKDLLMSVITSKNIEPSSNKSQKAEKEVYRNLICLLGFISNACVCLDNDQRIVPLIRRYLSDYHLVTRFKPSQLTFNLGTNFFFIINQNDVSMSSYNSLKSEIIAELRKSCRFFLEMTRNRVRVKHIKDSFLKYEKSTMESGFNEGLSLRVRLDSWERKFGKKINGRVLTRDLLLTFLSMFSARNWREMDLFEMWDEEIQIIKSNQIDQVIKGNDEQGLRGEVVKVAQVLSSRETPQAFVELKINQ
jgi:hypothetical protein